MAATLKRGLTAGLTRTVVCMGREPEKFTCSAQFITEGGRDYWQVVAQQPGKAALVIRLNAVPFENFKKGDVHARNPDAIIGSPEKPGQHISHDAFSRKPYSSDPSEKSGYKSNFWNSSEEPCDGDTEPAPGGRPMTGNWTGMRPKGRIGWETICFDPKLAHFNTDGFRKTKDNMVQMRVPVYVHPDGTVHRTGVQGRGVLGRWGPNGASDPVVTCWKIKRDATGNLVTRNGHFVIECDHEGFPLLDYVCIVRKDTGELAHPGGMNIMEITTPEGETVSVEVPCSMTLANEFLEEACAHADESEQDQLASDKLAEQRRIRDEFLKLIDKIRIVIKCGRNGDPRNTDNAWMVVEVSSIHCDDPTPKGFFNKFELRAGSDAAKVSVRPVSPATMPNMYASHGEDVLAAYNLQYYRLTCKLPGQLATPGEVFRLGDFEYELA